MNATIAAATTTSATKVAIVGCMDILSMVTITVRIATIQHPYTERKLQGTTPCPSQAICPSINPITLQLLNGSTVVSTHTTTILLPDLPAMAGHAHIFPDLMNRSLISVGQLCDHGCKALFISDHMVISKNGQPILTGN